MKYCVPDWRQGQEPGKLNVGEKNYLLTAILEILLQCSVFITALTTASAVSINIVIFQTQGPSVTILTN